MQDVPDNLSQEEEDFWSNVDEMENPLDRDPSEPVEEPEEEEPLEQTEAVNDEEEEEPEADGEEQPEADEEEESEEPVEDSNDTDETEDEVESDSEEEEQPTAYEVNWDKVQFDPIKANGVSMPISSKEELYKFASAGINFTKKSQKLAPYSKVISAIEENNITPEQLFTLIEANGGSKEAITSLVKQSGVDTLDIDTEAESTYSPKSYGKSEEQLAMADVMSDIGADTEYLDKTNTALNAIDQGFYDSISKDPSLMRGFHEEVKMGNFDKVFGEAAKRSVLNPGVSQLDHYLQVKQEMMDASSPVQETKPEPTPRKVVDTKRRKVASSPKKKSSNKNSTVNYADESPDGEKAYQKWLASLGV